MGGPNETHSLESCEERNSFAQERSWESHALTIVWGHGLQPVKFWRMKWSHCTTNERPTMKNRLWQLTLFCLYVSKKPMSERSQLYHEDKPSKQFPYQASKNATYATPVRMLWCWMQTWCNTYNRPKKTCACWSMKTARIPSCHIIVVGYWVMPRHAFRQPQLYTMQCTNMKTPTTSSCLDGVTHQYQPYNGPPKLSYGP